MYRLFHIAIISIVLATVSCVGSKRDYSRWTEIPLAGWSYADTVSFLFADTVAVPFGGDSIIEDCEIKVALRHSNRYRYSNLWLEVTYHSDSVSLVRDTVNVRLADVYGRWLGSGFGASYQRELTVDSVAIIDIAYPVTLRHIMRVDTLDGIEQVGVEVLSRR